jgi:hypothetical protein
VQARSFASFRECYGASIIPRVRLVRSILSWPRGNAMSIWPRYPTLYEINTWVWLSELSLRTGRLVDLGNVPSDEWDAVAKFGFDAVWLMGVWERSPAGISIANQNQNLVDDFRRTLPDFRLEDNVGIALLHKTLRG